MVIPYIVSFSRMYYLFPTDINDGDHAYVTVNQPKETKDHSPCTLKSMGKVAIARQPGAKQHCDI